MNADVYSVCYDASTGFWHWTRTPHGDPAACVRQSTERFVKVADAVSAARTIAADNGIFLLPFDDGKGGKKSVPRFQLLLQQIRDSETHEQLERATQALFNYDLDLYHCANRTTIAYKRREIAEKMANSFITITLINNLAPVTESMEFALAA